VLYGEHGIGKSTWAASAKGAVFIDIEGGLDDIDCRSFPQCHDLSAVRECVINADQIEGVRWVVIDSADWLEALIWKDLCGSTNAESILAYGGGFGKGYLAAAQKFEAVLIALDGLRAKGIGIIFLAHAKIARFESPETAAYDRFQPALHDRTAAMLLEWADEVLFATTKVFTKKEDAGFGRERNIAVGGKERVLKTASSATCVAKNRLGLPDEIPMEWQEYAKYLTPWNVSPAVLPAVSKPPIAAVSAPASANPLMQEMETAFGDIRGIVTNGSSKNETV